MSAERAAVVLESPGRVFLRTVPWDTTEGLAEVAIEQVGVCGTDVGVVSGKFPAATPLVLGHELIGRTVGPCGSFPAGTRVLVDPIRWCGRCEVCRRGLMHLCPNGGLMGRDFDGGMAARVAVPEDHLHAVPDGLDRDTAATLQVLGTCVHAQRHVELLPWENAVVVGLGVSGLLHLQLLRARGAKVLGVGRSPAKRELALQFGASAACEPRDAVSVLAECTRGYGADLVIEAAGTAETVALAVALAAPGASVVLFGTVAGEGQPAPFYEMYRKELHLFSPRAAVGADYRDAVTLASSGVVSGGGLVTHRLPLGDAPGVLGGWASDPTRLKVVFEL